MRHLFLIGLLCLLLSFAQGARILFFSGLSTYSHRILVWPLVEELSRRGHEVTYFSSSPNRNPHPNVTDFVPSEVLKFYKGEGVMNSNLLHARLEGRLFEMWKKMPEFGQLLCSLILKSPDTKEWAASNSFDLIFIDALFNDCGFGFVHKFKAKHILFGTTTLFSWNYDPNGILPETSWIPEVLTHFPGGNMGFGERLISTLEHLRWHFLRKYSYLPRVEEIIRNELKLEDMPPISELEKDVSLFFTNTHFSEEYARALPPFVITVGGLHIRDSTNSSTFSNKLRKFINERGENGFIYISFGSDTPISTLPPTQLRAMFDALKGSGLPCIWKWDEKIPEFVPENVLMEKWVPQQALLSHPKIKMMIMHGGLLSIHEAIHHKVPLIVIPIFAEQDFNAERIQRKGFGLSLEIQDLTEGILRNAIESILRDPTYKEKVGEVSTLFHDRINTPLQTAVWYTEYALRHNNTEYLKPYSMHQAWYVRRLVDVWFFIFLIIGIALTLCLFILKNILKYGLIIFISKSNSSTLNKKLK